MRWRDAEELAARWMRETGFRDARITGGVADAGIDVVASGAIAQVKLEQQASGRPALQRLVGARRRQHHLALLFFSLAGYTRAALAYADEMGMALLTFDFDGRVSPVNEHARAMVRAARLADADLQLRAEAVGLAIRASDNPDRVLQEIARRERREEVLQSLRELWDDISSAARQWRETRRVTAAMKPPRPAKLRPQSRHPATDRRVAGTYRFVSAQTGDQRGLRPVNTRVIGWTAVLPALLIVVAILASEVWGWGDTVVWLLFAGAITTAMALLVLRSRR